METRRVRIYRQRGVLYFEPFCGALGIYPIRSVEEPASPRQVGEAALTTLDDCRPKGTVPWPKDWEAYTAPMLATMKVASVAELIAGASSISLDLEGDQLIARPSRNTGPDRGFGPLPPEKDIVIPATSSPEEIGAAIERALAACEEGPPPPPPPLIED